jgi:hypothetical protein
MQSCDVFISQNHHHLLQQCDLQVLDEFEELPLHFMNFYGGSDLRQVCI